MGSPNTDYDKIFSDWFNELESYGMRCERFYDDASIQDAFRRDVILTKWLREAFMQGVKASEHLLP